MSSRTYPHLADRLLNTPLLLHPQKLDAIIACLGGRLLGVDGLQIDAAQLSARAALPAEMFTTRRGERADRGYRVVDGVAIISAMGGLVHRTQLTADSSVLIGYNDIAADMEDALSKPEVHTIALVLLSWQTASTPPVAASPLWRWPMAWPLALRIWQRARRMR